MDRQLGTAFGAALLFIAVNIWYISGFAYPGPVPIGIAAGVTACAELVIFVLSLKNFKRYGIIWKTALVTVVSFSAMLLSGGFFSLWAFLTVAGFW